MIQRREAHHASLVNNSLCSAVDQGSDIFQTIARTFRGIGLEVVSISDGIDELAEQIVDTGGLRALAKPANESCKFLERAAGSRPNVRKEVGLRSNVEHRQPGLSRGCCNRLDRSLTELSFRDRYRAAERLVVGRIRDKLEVAHEIPNLPAIVESHRTHKAIRNRVLAERILQRAALRVRPVQDREIAKLSLLRRSPRLNLVHDEIGFITLIQRREESDRVPALARCP